MPTPLKVHLVDGTYELFRHHFGVPSHVTRDGQEVAATRGVLGNLLYLLDEGATHVAVATDHVIESFRNELWIHYKTGDGIAPELKSQFPLLEDGLRAMGVLTWAMVELEADDALASGAAAFRDHPDVEQVLILTPDKDLGQCVVGQHVVQVDRRKRVMIDEDGVRLKFGVPPSAIPDYLALVGDSADGFPGIPGFGAKSAAAVLQRYGCIEDIPEAPGQWDVPGLRGVPKLAATLAECREAAALFKVLATLRVDPTLEGLDDLDALRWRGPTDAFADVCAAIDAPDLVAKAERLAERRAR